MPITENASTLADERTHDANTHLLIGPRLKQPSIWRMIARAHGTLVIAERPALTPREKKRRSRERGMRGLALHILTAA